MDEYKKQKALSRPEKQIPACSFLFLLPSHELIASGYTATYLSETAIFRLCMISFFLVVILLCSRFIQNIWNSLKNDFSFLPELNYKKSITFTSFLGFVVLIVLTMFSGVENLLTYNSWKKKEIETARIQQIEELKKDGAKKYNNLALLVKRKHHLERLQDSLWTFASKNNGEFPKSIEESGIPEEYWTMPDQYQLQYQYHPGLKPADKGKPEILVTELDFYEDEPFALKNDGTIIQVSRQVLKPLPKQGNLK